MNVERISRQHLNSAIDLFSRRHSIYSVHLLAMAASKLIYDATPVDKRPANSREWITEEWLSQNPGAKALEAVRALEEVFNYLKHGKDDFKNFPSWFSNRLNAQIALLACQDFAALYGYMTPYMQTYCLWAMVRYSDSFSAHDPELVTFLRNWFPDVDRLAPDEAIRSLRRALENPEIANEAARFGALKRRGKLKAAPPSAG